MNSVTRMYAAAGLVIGIILSASPAHAQFQPRPLGDPATGEQYHIEAAAAFWFPTANMVVASERFGIQGTSINFKTDLGLQDKNLPDLRLVLSPSRPHKFRFEFIPIKYEQTGTLKRRIIFNGIAYNIGLPVNSVLDWKAYRIAYEFDFISKDRGFAGFVVEAKYTDVNIQLFSAIANEFAHAKAPIPAIGGTGRFYVVPNISITGEVTGFKLPKDLVKNTSAHYVDFDLYGTVNFTNNIGAQFGYRSLNVGYIVDHDPNVAVAPFCGSPAEDCGDFTMKGIYFGVVARY
jgi:hypothetical protein